MNLALRFLDSLSGVASDQWDAISDGSVFLKHAFLHALHETGCASARTGWQVAYPSLWQGDRLLAAMPLYVKSHSWGEYVFDWAWAEAYERAGGHYYPKLTAAIPFTPVAGSRLLARSDEHRTLLVDAALQLAQAQGISSLHCLFPQGAEVPLWQSAGLMLRHGVQFHWLNQGYRDYQDFLDGLQSEKRKKIRQERRKIAEQGIEVQRKTGAEISEADWRFFYRCYVHTYQAHGSRPYLSLDFFQQIGRDLAGHCLLVLALKHGKPVAAALDLFDAQRLYGRYWGALEYLPNLHFELCYYQGIEFAIAQQLQVFEGGAQGEHKLSRGLSPVATVSAHWLADSRFADAVSHFLQRESGGVEAYLDELNERAPFRRA
ncbi:GNAT family N-acetyltransferase [Parachitinimonas caeni]|uniref:GNAT family N-acetyltransferase n=1 Tax=Parachitinimonas caeni TaxID=3031301 RepID=A0ABT7E064_9NEIS|nr:GNAT family N-acetyltransferase [Parachitinimonas caeni]MDK2124302.1 GNAT family N-acetyltransferase [Parachitinimonas caeni]